MKKMLLGGALVCVALTGFAAENGAGTHTSVTSVCPVVRWDFRGDTTHGWKILMGIQQFRPTPEGLALSCTTTDPAINIRVNLEARDWKRAVVRMQLPTNAAGPVRLFWADRSGLTHTPVQENEPPETDGQMHDYVFYLQGNPHWKDHIGLLRFDPCECPGEVLIESIALEDKIPLEALLGTANPQGGVMFTVPPRTRTSWAHVEWYGDETEGRRRLANHFHLVGDGRARRYYFDGAACTSFGGNYYNEKQKGHWRGSIRIFNILDGWTGKRIPIQDVVFTDRKPDIPGELVLSATDTPLAFNRVGQNFPVEIGLFNPGTLPVEGAQVEITGLPENVRLVNDAAARRVLSLPGWSSALHRIILHAESPCAFTLHARFFGGGIPENRVDVPVKVVPSLGLARADYVPEPKALAKEPWEVGAFYFCDWVRPDHWLKIWRIDPKRKPALGWYNNKCSEVLDWQIKWAVENGISFYIVDWYAGKGWHSVDFFEQALAHARYRKYIKWAAMWCNHGKSHEEEWQDVVKRLITTCFNTPEYMQVDGKPYVSIWDPDAFDRDNGPGSCRRLLEFARQMARGAGYAGIYFQAMVLRDDAPASGRSLAERRREQGFDEVTAYHFLGTNGKQIGPRTSSFDAVADAWYDYWKACADVKGIATLPNLSTGWDDQPWNDGFCVSNKNVAAFRRMCEGAKRFGTETGIRRFVLAPLNEWGEGSYAEPNGEFGFGFFEAIRETFFSKPAAGWPLNYTPADVGRGPYDIPQTEGVIPCINDRRWR